MNLALNPTNTPHVFQVETTWRWWEVIAWSYSEYLLFSNDSYQETTCYYRSSHRRCSMWKDVLRNFTKFTGKHLCQSHFFNKVVGLRPTTLLKKRLLALKKRLWHNCFPVNFAKFLKPSLFTEHLSTTASRCCRVSMEQYEKYIWKPDGCAWKNVAIKNWKNILC